MSNPERYIVLHEAAKELLNHLEQTYRVRRSEPSPESQLLIYRRATSAVRLDPDDTKSGPLVCTFTEFPGVVLTLGGGYEPAFPVCGCDACGEEPDYLVSELRRTAEQFVSGGLVESVTGHTYSFRLGGLSGSTLLPDGDRRLKLPASRTWKAWPR